MVTTSLSIVQKGKELWEKEKHIAVSVNCFFLCCLTLVLFSMVEP